MMQGQGSQGQAPCARVSWESFAFVDEDGEENEDENELDKGMQKEVGFVMDNLTFKRHAVCMSGAKTMSVMW